MRPQIDRPTVVGLDGDHSFLQVAGSPPLPLDSPDFDAAISRISTFGVETPGVSFLVISERRSRGNHYWIARGYKDGRRASSYIGRRVNLFKLREAAIELERRLAAPDIRDSSIRPADGTSVKMVLDEMLVRETDPARRAAAQAIADFVLCGGRIPPLP
jgi:hypothetical protein